MGRRNESRSGGGGGGGSSHRERGRTRHDNRNRDDNDDGGTTSRHHRHHRHRGNDDDDNNGHDDRQRHRRHHSRHHGNGDRSEDDNNRSREETSAKRSHRRSRREHRNRSEDDNNDNDQYGNDGRDRRSRHGGGSRDNAYDRNDAPSHQQQQQQRGRKRYRGGGGHSSSSGDHDDSERNSDNGGAAGGRRHNQGWRRDGAEDVAPFSGSSEQRSRNQRAQADTRVDWSSRRGRQRMPNLAYDVDQQKHFLGFLDRKDASGVRTGGGVGGFDLKIGPDGLVQMPPPNNLVRRHGRYDRTNNNNSNDSNNASRLPSYTGSRNANAHPQRRHQQQQESRVEKDDDVDDGNSSVASHESLYNDPSTAHLGILPDMLPPSNLYRVALYGVDLSVSAEHMSSVVTQLLGSSAKPYRARRPAREMLLAAESYNSAPSHPDAALPSATSAGILSSAETHLDTMSAPATTSAGVLSSVLSYPGILGDDDSAGGADAASAPAVLGMDEQEQQHQQPSSSGVLGHGGERGESSGAIVDEEESYILPDASVLPQPPAPSAPALYLPGLHDVNGPGGMVVLEFTDHGHACRTVQVLNGGYLNGRRIAASM